MSRLASSKTARIWAERFAQCERSNAPVAQRTQGGASLCPGFDGPEYSQALKGRNLSARKTIRYRTQGGASLCPGLSHFAPFGAGASQPYRVGTVPGFSPRHSLHHRRQTTRCPPSRQHHLAQPEQPEQPERGYLGDHGLWFDQPWDLRPPPCTRPNSALQPFHGLQ